MRSFGVGSLSPLQVKPQNNLNMNQVAGCNALWAAQGLQDQSPAVIVNAKTTSNVQVLQLKALRPYLLDKICHDNCSLPKDVHLHNTERAEYWT